MSFRALLVAIALVRACSVNVTKQPHLIAILADDLGWYDTSINNPDAPTPAIKHALDNGLRLDYHYVFRYCSPSRRSFMTGRFPNSISNAQAPVCSNYLPLEMATIGDKLSKAGYACHYIGKGHLRCV